MLGLLTLLVLITLHEGGHVLAGWATGAHVTEFDILSVRPHVRLSGASTPATNAIRAIAGSGMVLIGWAALILCIPRRRAFQPVRTTATFFAGIELLGWFLSAVMHTFQPQRNDAGKFLKLTALEPWTAALGCLVLAATGMTLLALQRQPAATRS